MSLRLAGRRVVVVGGGRVATRRVGQLIEAGAEVSVVAPRVSPELAAWAEAGAVGLSRRLFEPGDVDAAWLVFAATDDSAVNSDVVAAAEARRCWASSASGAGSCQPMSVLRRGQLEVAVGTSGRSPALAGWLRRRLEAQVGPEYGVLLDLAGDARDDRRAEGDIPDAPDWYALFDSGILELIRSGRVEEAREELRTCLSS